MTEATASNHHNSWFDRRITLSGIVQILLLMFAIFKFSSDLDKRVALLEETKRLHEALIKSNGVAIEILKDSTQRIVTIIEQYQRTSRP